MASATWVAPPTGNHSPTCAIDASAGGVAISERESISYEGTVSNRDGGIAGYAWTFNGGTPLTAGVVAPGGVSYSTAGTYLTTITATDGAGASCAQASLQVTVNQVGGSLQAGGSDPLVTGF